MPEAVLFDLDDTIIAWDAVADQSWRTVCSRFSAGNPNLDGDKLFFSIKEARDAFLADPERHRWSRLNLEEYRREVASLGLTHLGVNIPGLDLEIARAYGEQREAAACVIPGAIDKLRRLRERGVRLALVTNGRGETQRRKIERFKLGHFFDHIAIEGEFGSGKPDERIFRAVLDNLRVHPSNAWMVGDDLERDVVGAQRSGILAVWVDWRGTGLPSPTAIKPDRIIRTVAELHLDGWSV